MEVRGRIQQIIDSREDLSVRNVSLSAGMSDSALHKFLTNSTQSMSAQNLEKIAKALGVSFRYLMFGEEAEIVEIWDRIPESRRPHARDVLETFTKRA